MNEHTIQLKELIKFGKSGVVYIGDSLVRLNSSEFKFFEILFQNIGEEVSTQNICEVMWPTDVGGHTNNRGRLASILNRLRNKLNRVPHCPLDIKTIYGFGYSMHFYPSQVDDKNSQASKNNFWEWLDRINYRSFELSQIENWILNSQNSTVIGLPGMGKSTFLDYLCQKPIKSPPSQLPPILVSIDMINLITPDDVTLYRFIVRAFYFSKQRFPKEMYTMIDDAYEDVKRSDDLFLAQSTLHEILARLRELGIQIVLVLRNLEHFLANTATKTTQLLKGLQDNHKKTLIYIAGLSVDMHYLSHLDSSEPLKQLFDSNILWLGPLRASDFQMMVEQYASHLTSPLTSSEIKNILDLTGSIPSLIRLVCANWSVGGEYFDQPSQLAKVKNIHHRLTKIWDSLTFEEQSILQVLALSSAKRKKNLQTKIEYRQVLNSLLMKGVVRIDADECYVNGEILSAFVKEQSTIRGGIRFDELTGNIFIGSENLLNLSPISHATLKFFVKNPYIKHTLTALIEGAWPDDVIREGVSSDAIYQVIRDLRKHIEPEPSRPRHIITWRGHPEGGYQFFPEGRPK